MRNRRPRRISASRRLRKSIVASRNDIVKIENALNGMVGGPATKAMDYLARFGFDNTYLNGKDGYRNTSDIDQYDTWAGYEDEDGHYVKLTYTMVRDRNRGGNAFKAGKLRGVYVEGYEIDASTKTRKRPIKAAESYGWVVEDWEAWDAYEFALDNGWDQNDLNEQIVQALDSSELAACLAFIFRVNDFQEWDERGSEDYE